MLGSAFGTALAMYDDDVDDDDDDDDDYYYYTTSPATITTPTRTDTTTVALVSIPTAATLLCYQTFSTHDQELRWRTRDQGLRRMWGFETRKAMRD